MLPATPVAEIVTVAVLAGPCGLAAAVMVTLRGPLEGEPLAADRVSQPWLLLAVHEALLLNLISCLPPLFTGFHCVRVT